MENYSSFNQKALASLGIKIGVAERKFDKPLRMFVLAVVMAATIQSILFLATASNFDLSLANAFTIGLYSMQGCFKIAAVLWNTEKLKELKESLNGLMVSMKVTKDAQNTKELKKFQKITKVCLLTNVTCIWIFHFKPLIEMLTFYLTQGIVYQKQPFAFYYPFDDSDYYFPVYFIQIIFGHFLTIAPQAMDGLIMLMVGQLTVLFKSLGDKFAEIINEFEVSKKAATVEKMKKVIDLHEKVFELSENLFQIYETPLLANVLMQTGTICFIAFIISVRL